MIAMLCACSGVALGQAENSVPNRPAASGRVVHAFDFEEQDTNPLPVPMGWLRAQEDPAVPRVRPGFPIWNGAVLDYESPAFAGTGSVKLPTNGGSTSLMLRYGELSIFPDADYLISTRVHTQGLKHARARLVATLLDQKGNELPMSRVASPLIRSENDWQQIAIEVEGLNPSAAFMKLELQLLQPEQQQEHNASQAFRVWDQDYSGAAWFDNLIIAQLPRLNISTGSPGNIIESDNPPDLHLLVRDLTGEEIHANLRIFDVHANLVQQELLNSDGRRVQRRWTTELPGFGWYRALLEVIVDRQLVGVRTLDFIWAPPKQSQHRSGMFAIESSITDPRMALAVPSLVHGSGVDRVSLRIWDRNTTREDLKPGSALINTITTLLDENDRLSFTLAELPMALAETMAVDPDEVLEAFKDPNGAWTQWGASMLDQYGQRVTNWQFGTRPSEESAATLFTALRDARRSLSGFVPGPLSTIAWPIDRPLAPELASPGIELQLIDDNTVAPEAISQLVEQWASERTSTQGRDEPESRLGITLRPQHDPRDQDGTQVWSAVGALARKAISFWWSASLSGINQDDFELRLSDAWWISTGRRGEVMPAPELIVWRTLANHLGTRRAVEELDLIPGARLLVVSPRASLGHDFDEDRSAAQGGLVVWLDEPSLDPLYLQLPLARTPVQVYDMFGNMTQIDPVASGNIGSLTHRIEITRSPQIIEGINPELVRFLSSIRLTPDTLEARSGIHKHALQVRNPWPIPIAGRVYIVEPGGFTDKPNEIDRTWDIVPRVLKFSLPPGEQRSIPVDIAYSLGELAGLKDLVFDVELQADNDYPIMRVRREIELALPGVEMELTAKTNQAGISVITATVTHSLKSEQHFDVIAIAPDQPRIRRSMNAMAMGQPMSRQFAFTGLQSGDEVVVVLLPRDTSTRLNKSVIVP